jgi:hypothetical protein
MPRETGINETNHWCCMEVNGIKDGCCMGNGGYREGGINGTEDIW